MTKLSIFDFSDDSHHVRSISLWVHPLSGWKHFLPQDNSANRVGFGHHEKLLIFQPEKNIHHVIPWQMGGQQEAPVKDTAADYGELSWDVIEVIRVVLQQ